MNGRANPIGPESCVSDREVWGEALTGESMGQVLVRDRKAGRPTVGGPVATPPRTWGRHHGALC
jgi:hypothetical protein